MNIDKQKITKLNEQKTKKSCNKQKLRKSQQKKIMK